MLANVVAELELEAPSIVPATHGEAMQREFFWQVAELSPGADRILHGGDGDGPRPYTLSPLMGRFHFDRGRLRLEPGDPYWFRLTGVGATTCELLHAVAALVRTWRVTGRSFEARFSVRRWLTSGGRSGRGTWCGAISQRQLWQSAIRDVEQQPDRVELHFYSPTSFHLDNGSWARWYHLPDPALVFESVRKRLHSALADLPEPADWKPVIGDGLALGRCEVKTHVLSFEGHQRTRVGFTGDCEFLINPGMPAPERVWLHLLADAAFYTGVGGGTSWGMGQARREPVEQFSYRLM